jgi:hypothetical protein
MDLTHLLCAAELDQGLPAGFFACEAVADAGVCMQSDVTFELGIEVVLSGRAMKESAETKDEGSEFRHVHGPD